MPILPPKRPANEPVPVKLGPPRTLDPKVLELIEAFFREPARPEVPPDTERLKVNETVSKMAFFYERLRNAIDFKEEHLFRRSAIERNLKRRLLLERRSDVLARGLLYELIRGRYLPNGTIPETRIGEVAQLLEKYVQFFALARRSSRWMVAQELSNWMLQIASSEIDDYLVPHTQNEALLDYAQATLDPQLRLQDGAVPEPMRAPLIRVALHRTILKSDPATINYRLIRMVVPAWFTNPTPEVIQYFLQHAPRIRQGIDLLHKHVLLEPLIRHIRRTTILFLTLRDLILKAGPAARERLAQPEYLTNDATEVSSTRYRELQSKLLRITIRSVIYLLATKFVIAIILEVPYDLFVHGRLLLLPLGVNLVFHPLLLLLLGITIHVPIKKSTEKIIAQLQAMVYQPQDQTVFQRMRRPVKASRLNSLFVGVYILTFLLSYGLITVALDRIGFEALGTGLFLLFLSLVSYFGFSIRARARDVVVIDQRESALTLILDFLSIPVLAVGRWISLSVPRVNFLILFMDFLVEAPYKSLVQFVEDWVGFQKERKEELL